MNKLGVALLLAASASSHAGAQQADPRDGFGYALKGASAYPQRLSDATNASRQTSSYNDPQARALTDRPAQADSQQIRDNPLKVQINVPPPPQSGSFFDPGAYNDPWRVDPATGWSLCEIYLYYSQFDPTMQVPPGCIDKRAQQVHQMQGVAQRIKQLSDSYRPSNTAVTQATYVQAPDQGGIQDAAAAQGLPGNIGATATGLQQDYRQQNNR